MTEDMAQLANPQLYRLLTILCKRRVKDWVDGRSCAVAGVKRRRTETVVNDLVQSAYLQAVKYWDRYDPTRGSLSTWLVWCLRSAIQVEKLKRQTQKRTAIAVSTEADLRPQGAAFDEDEATDVRANKSIENAGIPARQDEIVYAKEVWRAHERVGQHKCNQTRARQRRSEEFAKWAEGYSVEELAEAHGLSRAMVDLDIKQHRKELVQYLERRS